MPEEFLLRVYPLVDQLMIELKNGAEYSPSSKDLRRKLRSYGAQVATHSRGSKSVVVRWPSQRDVLKAAA